MTSEAFSIQRIRDGKDTLNVVRGHVSDYELQDQNALSGEIQRQARRQARPLIRILQDMMRQDAFMPNQMSGAYVDRRKYRDVIAATKQGRDPVKTKPHVRKTTTVKDIHIGIATGFAWYLSHRDKTLLDRIGKATLALQFALEAVGAHVSSTLIMEEYKDTQYNYAFDLASPKRRTNAKAYNVFIETTKWNGKDTRKGYSGHGALAEAMNTPLLQNEALMKELYGLSKLTPPQSMNQRLQDINRGKIVTSARGGQGVRYLRANGANIVIGIGALRDIDNADIQIPQTNDLTPEKVIDEVVKQIKSIRTN